MAAAWAFTGPGTSALARPLALFESDEPLELRLEAPISLLKKQRGEELEWLDGKVVWQRPGEGGEVEFSVQIRARGNFRRKREICQFPPYWMKFEKSQPSESPFEGVSRVKVVAHCREGRKSIAANIYKEYLVYRTYNLLTDRSFRVRLARIEYDETGETKNREQEPAFFIEHVSALSKRVDGKPIETRDILPSDYDLAELCRAELFEFFIGCTDFSFFTSLDECCHNAKAFSFADPSTGIAPVPYDFDLSGLVNPPYAIVNPRIPIRNIKQRFYRGVKVPDQVLADTVALFLEKKGEILELWKNAEPLPEKDRAEALAYIESFYRILNDPERFDAMIVSRMADLEKTEERILTRIHN